MTSEVKRERRNILDRGIDTQASEHFQGMLRMINILRLEMQGCFKNLIFFQKAKGRLGGVLKRE